MVGDCFLVAASFAELLPELCQERREPWRVVHGLPVFRGEGADGEARFWHGWIEHRERDGSVEVLDYSNGREVRLLRQMFYAVGRLDEQHVWRFTPAEALAARARFGHAGPWVDGWEQMGDGDDPDTVWHATKGQADGHI